MVEKTFCVFSLSRRDEAFEDAEIDDVKEWLMTEKKAEEAYLFAEKSPRRVASGSKILFSFDAQVFGKATAKSDIEEISFEEQEKQRITGKRVYKHSIVFDGTTVRLLRNVVTKRDIAERLDINLDRLFRYLTEAQYNEILKMSE